MKRAVFTADANQSSFFKGYTSGSLWNGWECPSFEIAEAMEIMALYNSRWDDEAPMQYNAESDTFYVDENECYKGFNAKTEDGLKHLYDIGAYYWTWEKYTLDKDDWVEVVQNHIREKYNLDDELIESTTMDIVFRCFAYGVPQLHDLPSYIADYMKR